MHFKLNCELTNRLGVEIYVLLVTSKRSPHASKHAQAVFITNVETNKTGLGHIINTEKYTCSLYTLVYNNFKFIAYNT